MVAGAAGRPAAKIDGCSRQNPAYRPGRSLIHFSIDGRGFAGPLQESRALRVKRPAFLRRRHGGRPPCTAYGRKAGRDASVCGRGVARPAFSRILKYTALQKGAKKCLRVRPFFAFWPPRRIRRVGLLPRLWKIRVAFEGKVYYTGIGTSGRAPLRKRIQTGSAEKREE